VKKSTGLLKAGRGGSNNVEQRKSLGHPSGRIRREGTKSESCLVEAREGRKAELTFRRHHRGRKALRPVSKEDKEDCQLEGSLGPQEEGGRRTPKVVRRTASPLETRA